MQAKVKNWVYTDLSEPDTLRLIIDGEAYEVAQVVTSFARNEIPTASCLLAIGRSTKNLENRARIHETAPTLTSMLPCTIEFHPRGFVDTEGTEWPEGAKVIFDGYFQGFSYQKLNGRVQVVAQLIHWLSDLGATSAFSSVSHPRNPSSLVFSALAGNARPTRGSGGSGLAATVAKYVGYTVIRDRVSEDLWSAIKGFLCAIANHEGWDPVGGGGCLFGHRMTTNDKAITALKRIEGETDDECSMPYQFGRALPLFTGGLRQIPQGVADAFGNIPTANFANHTLWDILVGHLCPMYGMAVIPMVDRAIIVADTPGFQQNWTPEITPNEYNSVNYNPKIAKPLRGVALAVGVQSRTGGSFTDRSPVAEDLGGCYLSTAPEDATGTIMVVPPPPWLISAAKAGIDFKKPPEQGTGNPMPTATSRDAVGSEPDEAPTSRFRDLNTIYSRYARKVYLDNNLRTRTGSTSGILRFDIAPGSHLKLLGDTEGFIGGEDELAATLFGDVSRVTVAINSEARQAATSYQLMHIRTEKENQEERTSVGTHMLFDDNVVTGAPLVEDYYFDE